MAIERKRENQACSPHSLPPLALRFISSLSPSLFLSLSLSLQAIFSMLYFAMLFHHSKCLTVPKRVNFKLSVNLVLSFQLILYADFY